MDQEIEKKNKALKYLGQTIKDKKRFIFSKLGNELTLITTKACNLNCPFCYDKANIHDKKYLSKIKEELTSEEIINLIKVCKKIGMNNIRLTGGEALLKPNFFKIIKACDGIYITLCSNGLELKKNLNKLIRLHKRDLHIHISLDGLETHKKYRVGSNPYDIIELLYFIKKKYPKVMVSINTVLNKENIYELLDIYKLIKDSKIDRWTISFPRLVENALEKNFKLPNIKDLCKEFNKLIKSYFKEKPFSLSFSYFYKFEIHEKSKYKIPSIKIAEHPCLPDANGTKGLIIDSFGNIIDCLVLKPLLDKAINIKEILKKKELTVEEFISKLYSSLDSKFYDLRLKNQKECLNCRYLKLCKGGCPANAFYLTGNFTNVDLTSCLMFYYFEMEVLANLPNKVKQQYLKLIDTSQDIKIIEKRIKKF